MSHKIEIDTMYFPCIITLGGKTFAAGGTLVEVPEGTTLRNIRWVQGEVVKKRYKAEIIGVFGSNSKPDTMYRVKRLENGVLICDCPGYQFRNKCRHINEVNENE